MPSGMQSDVPQDQCTPPVAGAEVVSASDQWCHSGPPGPKFGELTASGVPRTGR
jgi:hypothetical protein